MNDRPYCKTKSKYFEIKYNLMTLSRCTHVKKLRREEAIRRGDEVMEVCNQAFATLGQLTKHEKQVHPPADPDYPALGPNSFPCEGCVIRFNTKQGLRDHLKRNNCFSMQAGCYNFRIFEHFGI